MNSTVRLAGGLLSMALVGVFVAVPAVATSPGFGGFLENIRSDAIATLTEEEKTQLAEILANAPMWEQFVYFIGHPVIALLLSTLLALYFLGTRRGVDRETLLEVSTRALGPAGIIILITGEKSLMAM